MSVETETAENPWPREDENWHKWEQHAKREKEDARTALIQAGQLERALRDREQREAAAALKPHCPRCGHATKVSGGPCAFDCDCCSPKKSKTDAPKSKTRGRAPGRRDKKESRLSRLGPYAPVPRAILRDPTISLAAKGFAGVLFDRLNLGPWNIDLHIDASFPELFEVTNASESNLKRLAIDLREYLEKENLRRGGVRYRFIGPPVNPNGSTGE